MKAALARVRQRASADLRTRMSLLYGGLFAAALVLSAVAGQVMIVDHAQNSVRAELATSSSVFDRLWSLRTQAIANAADVLARDFGFRAAVASGDRPTIASALVNLRRRAGADEAIVLGQDGSVIGEDGGALGPTLGDLPYALAPGRHDAVIARGKEVFHVVVSPILAPTEIGWVVFVVRMDRAQLRSLEALSAIPLTATILRRSADGRHWDSAAGDEQAGRGVLDRLVADAMRQGRATPGLVSLSGGYAFALAKPLAGTGDRPEAVLLLSYPILAALAPYRTLQIGTLIAGLIGLLLVLWGSRGLARGITRPISALDAAARALERGDRTEVAIESSDEIGRLAESFNRMSAGIVERERQIAHMAFHDPLTGLPNRIFLRQQIDAAAGHAARTGGWVAVLCIDLDAFKDINDTLGHSAGDAVLRDIATLLTDHAVDGQVARLGGDEFAILLAGQLDRDRPRALAEALIEAIRRPIMIGRQELQIAASIGIAIGPADGGDAEALLKNADLALYRAKQDGRGLVRFFEPALDAAARHRRQMENDLRLAIRKGQFHLEFQPIFDLGQQRIRCFEALLRWDHPTSGAISPAEFIPVAEHAGLIDEIGEWVMYEATRRACHWAGAVRVAVNVSPLQFRHPDFAGVVLKALAHSGLAPERLEIEITESVFLEGESATVALLHSLRSIGVRIALDDFGTGYSSLSYLRSFPFDKIKIDRAFVLNIASDPSAAAIVRAIIDLAHALTMETTAEGVEQPDQLAVLRDQGCTSIQGWIFGRAVRGEAVAGLLAAEGKGSAAIRAA